MGDSKKARRRTAEEIENLLAGYDESGLTQTGFAERHEMSVATLRSWLARRRRWAGRDLSRSRFVPVSINPSTDVPSVLVDLGNGRSLQIPIDADHKRLADLLPVIVAAC